MFATLFARLWYLQVMSGDDYQAQAASQSVREIVVQPNRGLIVDAEGRPLVTNRTSWVISIDRTMLGKMAPDQQESLLRRVAGEVGKKKADIQGKLLNCGDSGSEAGTCWNGSPYQPIPIATDVRQRVALRILEQAEDFPAVLAEKQSVRAYPGPYGINAAHILGYLSPITEDELSAAEKDDDTSVNGASSVGRSGVEKQYDEWLRGMPGYKFVAVDSMGRVLGQDSHTNGRPGNTLVTSLDAKVQGVVERQLAQTIKTARQTYDKVTHRNYAADSGAAVVMDARTGRIVAMASQPTYDPDVWVGGISEKQFRHLYSKKAGTPLLSRATQGQFAPGSTWKPIMAVGALNNGFSEGTQLDCSSGVQVGNRWFKNYESASYGYISFAQALQLSCDSFFYRVGIHFWLKHGTDPTDVNAKDPLIAQAKSFGFGSETGVDLPGEASGRIADRHWKLAYFKAMKSYYCKLDEEPGSDFIHVFAHEFCLEGNYYREGDAVNYSIGQGDTIVTPLQLARAYAALSNGGTLWKPQLAKAIVSPSGKVVKRFKPKATAHVKASKSSMRYVDQALLGTPKVGTLAWKFIEFPLDKVHVRGKTGSAEVYGKQSTSWVATYDENYVVVMMVSQAGTGSGTSGPAVRKIWESLYGIRGMESTRNGRRSPGRHRLTTSRCSGPTVRSCRQRSPRATGRTDGPVAYAEARLGPHAGRARPPGHGRRAGVVRDLATRRSHRR